MEAFPYDDDEEEVGRVREYERGNKNRATLLEQIDRRAAGAS